MLAAGQRPIAGLYAAGELVGGCSTPCSPTPSITTERGDATFLIIDPKVTDRDACIATVHQWHTAAHTAERHGGQLLVCGDQVEVIDGGWKPRIC